MAKDLKLLPKLGLRYYNGEEEDTISPEPGDILFYQMDEHSSPFLKVGVKGLTNGLKDAKQFSHVSIVIDISPETGVALIAEGGGANIAYLRQSVITHQQKGIVFRAKEPSLRKRIAETAMCTTMAPDWGTEKYSHCEKAKYSTGKMLISPFVRKINQQASSGNMTQNQYDHYQNPALRSEEKPVSAKTDEAIWCSRFAKNVILAALAEEDKTEGERSSQLLSGATQQLSQGAKEEYYEKKKTKNPQSLLENPSPVELCTFLEYSDAFESLGAWNNYDDTEKGKNFYYNGGMPLKEGGRPFLHNMFPCQKKFQLIEKSVTIEVNVFGETEPRLPLKLSSGDKFFLVKEENLGGEVSVFIQPSETSLNLSFTYFLWEQIFALPKNTVLRSNFLKTFLILGDDLQENSEEIEDDEFVVVEKPVYQFRTDYVKLIEDLRRLRNSVENTPPYHLKAFHPFQKITRYVNEWEFFHKTGTGILKRMSRESYENIFDKRSLTDAAKNFGLFPEKKEDGFSSPFSSQLPNPQNS